MSDGTATAHLFRPKLITVLTEGYGAASFQKDLFAALTVAIVALPLSMAIAVASGVSPERGLYTSIVGGFLVSALGGSRYQIGGPAGAFIVLVAATVAKFGLNGLFRHRPVVGRITLSHALCRWARRASIIHSSARATYDALMVGSSQSWASRIISAARSRHSTSVIMATLHTGDADMTLHGGRPQIGKVVIPPKCSFELSELAPWWWPSTPGGNSLECLVSRPSKLVVLPRRLASPD